MAGIARYPAIAAVLRLPWLDVVELTEIEEIAAFARYKAELGGGLERNNGEAAALAWARVHGGTVIIDERAGTRAAKRDQIEVHGTLWLIANSTRSGKLEEDDAIKMIDQLGATDMALPTDGAGFLKWAYDEGLLP